MWAILLAFVIFSGRQRSFGNGMRFWTAFLLFFTSFSLNAQKASKLTENEARVARVSGRAPNELLVRFKPGATETRKKKSLEKIKGTASDLGRGRVVRKGTLAADAKVIKVEGDVEKVRAELAADPDVLYVEPNYKTKISAAVIPDDFEFEFLYGLYNTGANEGKPGADIKAPDAWKITKGSSNVVVAVIDTGVDYFHEDLRGNMWRNAREISGDGIDNDSNGYIDDVFGYDFVSGDNDPMDDHFHGTHVAGTIGAVGNNGIGVVGVAWDVRLMAVKSFNDQGGGTVAWAIGAIQYAIANGAKIINASWSAEDRSQALADAVAEAEAAGVIFVAAAGNSITDTPFYPAGYESVIAVASVGNKGLRSHFTNFGAHVDVSAPGEQILSTMPDGRYDMVSGTSMACPHVAGVAALILSRHPEFTPAQVATIIKNTVDEIKTDRPIGRGRVNAYAAALIELPLPYAVLRADANLSGAARFRGTASGEHFRHYTLSHGAENQPTNWTQFYASTTAVTNDVLMSGFDSSTMPDGLHTFKVEVYNVNGQSASDVVTVRVRNVQILSPETSDLLRAGEPIVLRGTVFGQGRRYGVSWSKGINQENWTTAGVMQPSAGEVVNGVLATLDPTVILPNEFYSFRLSATNSSGFVEHHLAEYIWVDDRLRPGFPVHLPFDGEYPFEDWRQVKVFDLDGDGHKEILIVDHGNSEGKVATLRVFRDDGTVAWTRELNNEEPYADVPAIGDVTGDGRPEIFVDVGPTLYAFTYDGKDLSGAWPVTLNQRRLGKVIADLDRDGKNELIALANSPNPNSPGALSISVYDGLGLSLQRWIFSVCELTNVTQRVFPVVANMDSDSALEIVIAAGCQGASLYDINTPGSAVWSRQLAGNALSSPVVGDLDDDGENDIVIATASPKRGVTAGVYVLNGAGDVKPGWPVLTDDSFETSPALGDVDSDGKLEIAVVGSFSYKLHLLEYDGFEAVGWPVSLDKVTLSGFPAIADINGDSLPEVLFNAPGNMEIALLDQDKGFIGGVNVWNSLGQVFSMSGVYPSIPYESSAVGPYFKAAPITITDLDGNGKLDLVGTSIDELTWTLNYSDYHFKRRSSIFAWELNAPAAQPHGVWPEFQRGPDNNGLLPGADEPTPVIVLLPIPDQIVAVGQGFSAVSLNQYLSYSGGPTPKLQWTATGQNQLRIEISDEGVATVLTPAGNWEGLERITFTVADEARTFERAAVVVFEARANFFPPVANPDRAVLIEDETALIDVLANDGDPRGSMLAVQSVIPPSHGSVTLLADGKIVYAPNTNYFGPDSFMYVVQNSVGAKSLGLVEIEVTGVNDLPVARDDRALTLEERTATIDVLANDSDPDGDTLQVVLRTQPANGVAVVNAQNKIVYQPQRAFNGTNVFIYSISDGKSAPATAQVTVVVRSLNSPPVAKPMEVVMNRNSTKDIIYSGEDPDGDSLTFRIIQAPGNGELFSYPTLGNYIPRKGFSGTDSFSYKATDGFLESEEAVVHITVRDANNPPSVRAQLFATRVNQAANFSVAASDLDDDPIAFSVLLLPKNGILEVNGSNFVYTPNLDFLGQDEFTVAVSDGKDSTSAKISIETTDKNTAPGANPKLVRTQPNTSVSFALTGADAELDTLGFTVTTSLKHGTLSGSAPYLVYHPDTNYLGPDRFFFTVNDGEFTSAAAPVTFKIAPKNTAPFASNQTVVATASGPVAVPLAVRDNENDFLQAVILKGPRSGRITGTGTNFVYSFGVNFFLADSFTYKLWDGQNFGNEATVRIERNIVNPPPAPPLFSGIQLTTTGQLLLSLTNKLGQDFRVESSIDLTNWITVTNAVSPGTFLFTAPATNNQVFFRAINQ